VRVHIVGAGLSGLTAAVLLAREGVQVTVYDNQDGIGGSPKFHPSVHTTPVQLSELEEYVGFDLHNLFTRCDPYPRFYYKTKQLTLPPYTAHNNAYCVERGLRETSIDNHLYRMAREDGVRFEFNSRIDLQQLEETTIVATGMYPGHYERLGLPSRRIYVTWSHREIDDQSTTGNIYMGPYVLPDYAYTAQVNGLDFALLFSHQPVLDTNRDSFKALLRSLGMGEYPEPWVDVAMDVPGKAVLFAGDTILAGTIAGVYEPFWGYGIVGALLSGRIAAKAILNREEAERDFQSFTSGFDRKFRRRERWTSHSPLTSGFLMRAGIAGARLRCLFNRRLASRPREPVRWFR